ncbi:MAG: thioredoxin domain-containing protein [Candidatus Aminicenantes bacterium]|nr:thioredoxin domain-containing protein [Candidatus Aminicenantes bacterium]
MADKIKVSCFQCGATNNYPAGVLGKQVVCGRCKTPLPVPGAVLELKADRLFVLVNSARLPVLLDFSSETCGPCHMMAPILERLAQRRAGEIMVVKVDIDRNPELAASFGIQAVPTFIIFHKQTERGRATGAMSEADFSLWVASRS